MQKPFNAEDLSTWYYYPIPIPIDSNGHGPGDLNDTIRMTYEVWDNEYRSYGSYVNLWDALEEALYLNKQRG